MDVLCKIVEFPSHGDVFAAVQKGEVDAGVAPQHFGLRHANEYGLVASTIMFSPFSIYFASKKGKQHDLLSHIDAHLSRWKRDKNSFYYQRLNYWMSSSGSLWPLPSWLLYASIITVISTLFFAGLSFFFKKMVARKTREVFEVEHNYREIYNSISDAIVIHEADSGIILDVNDAALTMYGYGSKEALLAAGLGGLCSQTPPYTEYVARQFLTKCIEEGSQVFEWQAKKQSGETIWVEVSLRKKELGETGKVLAVIRDITERKLTADALLENEERFRTLTALAPVGIYLTSPEGLCQYANPRWCDMAGLSMEEALGNGWTRGLHPDDRDRVFACWQEMTDSRGRWGQEYRFITPEGKVTWVYGLATPQFDTNGKIIRYIGINTDITERKQAEAALHESEERYRSLFDSSPDGLMLTAPDGRILSANESMCRLLGRTESEIIQIGRSGIMDTSDPRLVLVLEERARTGRINNVELTCVRKDGEKIPVELSSTVFQDKDGNARTSMIIHDITERRIGELRLLQQVDFNRRVLDSTAAHIAILDKDGTIIDVNTPWIRFAKENNGAEADKLGPGVSYYCPLSAEYGDVSNAAHAFDGILQVQRGERDSFQIEYPCHSPTKNRWFIMNVLPLTGAQGQVLVSHTDITLLKLTEEKLIATLSEKDILLREVHHRVKNNMAAIIGLFDLQRQTMDDLHSQTILVELSSRVRAMSLVHEKLYRSESLSQIDFQDYTQSLLSHLRTSFGSPDVRCEIDAHGVFLPLDMAVPCGMIINELITNALIDAFPQERSGGMEEAAYIWVTLRQDQDRFILSVADNGVGLPPGFDWHTTKTLGLSLVRMLGQHQLGGRYQVDQTHGVRFTLTFTIHNGTKTYE